VASHIFSQRRREDGDDLTGQRPPIATHPAFPAIVATWFAVLLGLGTLVIPAVLLERLVEASGIANLMPGAEPPFGVTARALCAGVAAAGGVLLGLALARRVALGHGAAPAERAPRPLAIADEFGDSGLERADSFMTPSPAESDVGQPAASAFEPHEQEAGMTDEPLMGAEKAAPPANQGDPLESLALEQLVERLETVIESRRARLREAAPRVPIVRTGALHSFEAAPPEDAARAAAAYLGRPVDFQPTRAMADDFSGPWDDEGADDVEAGYGSLLSLGNPLVYRDEEEVFAGAEVATQEIPEVALSVSNDAALRAALARLQRLSGAA
jgi:hypothetical protein